MLERQVDSRLESEYLVLWGTLSDGNLIFMRTALESIRENAWISNRFLGYIGVLAVTLSAIISVFVSRKIANPILELTDISNTAGKGRQRLTSWGSILIFCRRLWKRPYRN